MLRALTVLSSVLFMLGCGPKKLEDSADIKGTNANLCLEAAKVEQSEKYGSHSERYKRQESYSTWIYRTEFRFDNKDFWSVKNDYPPGLTNDGAQLERPGITASSRILLTEMKGVYSNLLSITPIESTFIVVKLYCIPSRLSVRRKPDETEQAVRTEYEYSKIPFVHRINNELGLSEYETSTSLDGVSTDKDIANHGDSAVVVRCNKSLSKQCRSDFLIDSGVLVVYAYPIEQRADWKRIHLFITEHLKKAMKE